MAQMDISELEGIVSSAIVDAASFIDSDVSPLRAKATRYYNAEPFGDERAGRSQVISQDVRDTVNAILPSLLRIFFGSEQAVQFVPKSAEDLPIAEQATDYVQYVISEDNPGFLTFHGWFKDALINKTGIVKYWADDATRIESRKFHYLDADQVMGLLSEEGVELVESEEENGYTSITVRKKTNDYRLCVANIPPEEFLISREAKTLEDATLVAHRTEKTVSDLIAMGYTEDQVAAAGIGDTTLEMNDERLARSPWNITIGAEDYSNPAQRRVAYCEAFLKVDFDGDGIAELRRICTMGTTHNVVHNELAESRPFALICPDPEPHMVIGNSIADLVMDIQRIKSQVWRLMLDSLGQAINPRTAVVENQVNLDDVMNDETGGIIRMRAPGMVQPFNQPFVGQNALPVLALLDETRESRTGITKASQGLNADVLQSTTKAAVAATVTAAQEHIEMIARIFAETGIKDLYRGLLKLAVQCQDKERIVRLRNKFVAVQPSMFDPMMDVSVNVGLGGGTREDKLATLTGIAAKQEAILQTLGPSNPICTLSQYSATLRKMAEMAGFRDASQFFNAVPADYQAPTPQPAEDPQAKTAMILAQVEQEKTRARISTDAGELDLKRDQMVMDDARERYKIMVDSRVKLAELQLKYGADMMSVNAKIDADNLQMQQDAQAQVNASNLPQEQPVQ
jgi:hypothetical protein